MLRRSALLEQSEHNVDSRSDDELIAAINHGDLPAFDALYHRYRDWILTLAYRFTRDRDAALDVLQETFIYVARKLPGFRRTAQFKTFLYPVVKHCALALRRKAARFQGGENIMLYEMEAVEPEAPQEFDALLAPITPEQREVVLLRFLDGFSLEEVGVALNLPIGTVKSRLHYAIKTLREHPGTAEFFLP